MIKNSISFGVAWVVAIENERWSSVPGMVRSTYCPGLNSKGIAVFSRSDTMSRVTGSIASTRAATVRIGMPPSSSSSS